jgi:CxC2 like cysteine cluster associated with KDZ transposases
MGADRPLGTHQSQNSFLSEWLPWQPIYLRELLDGEANGVGANCIHCSLRPGILRCLDCFGSPVWCKECAISTHRLQPFHRIQAWTGKCFSRSSLFEQGFVIYLGHHGQPCPAHREPELDMPMVGAEEEEHEAHEDGCRNMPIRNTMVIAHSNGIFHHRIQWCVCTGCAQPHIQLLRHGLFSASLVRPETAFTFDVLDNFYMDSMECKTACFSFFQKLKRFTNNTAPASVPVSVHDASTPLATH